MLGGAEQGLVDARDRLIGMSRSGKRAVLIAGDLFLLTASLWLALSIRYTTFYVPSDLASAATLMLAPVIGVSTFAWFGVYQQVTRYIGWDSILRILGCLALSILVWAMILLLIGANFVPRTVVVLAYPIIAGAVMVVSREAAGLLLRSAGVDLLRLQRVKKPIVIYGAGEVGHQLVKALLVSGEGRPVGFLDDTPSLWGQYVGGVKVYPPGKLERLMMREGVREVILAMPEAERKRRHGVVRWLQNYSVRIRTLPAIEDVANGRVTVSNLRPIEVTDLLGREEVPPDPQLMSRNIRGKSVMVTGAGGSIGGELVRQIWRQGPSSLVLVDSSEVALYEIESELTEAMERTPDAVPRPVLISILANVLDEARMTAAIRDHAVATIYHAAAYKHVPIVEANPVAGLVNNTFGTAQIAKVARACGIERFVLVSTDKAVRPTNVMGGSKRLAELILQAMASDPNCATVFTMVRFGNVLDSSGSVVRKFKRQIESGGPVTVTHPEVIRYFMSIPEAATLVIQAGAMARGGDVFVLDMGEAVRIADLAKSMIRLMGLDVRDETNPDGDISIEYVGLRSGEKLYEELLISDNTAATEHPRIMRLAEPSLPPAVLEHELNVLQAAIKQGDTDQIQAVLMRIVEGYRPTQPAPGHPVVAAFPANRTLH